jgi:hypothetical protein
MGDGTALYFTRWVGQRGGALGDRRGGGTWDDRDCLLDSLTTALECMPTQAVAATNASIATMALHCARRVQPKIGPSVVPKGRPKPPISENRGGATGASCGPSEKKPKMDDTAAASGAGRTNAEVPQPTPHPRAVATSPSNSGGSQQSDDDGGGLQGLLGGYGSDSDQSDSGDGGSSQPPRQQQQETDGKSRTVKPPVAVALPSAADLLDSSKPVSSTLGPPRGANPADEKVEDEVDDAVLSDFLF